MGGKDHFYRIHATVSYIGTQSTKPAGTAWPRTIDHSNLQSSPIHQKTQHHNKTPFRCNGALINCQSVTSKCRICILKLQITILEYVYSPRLGLKRLMISHHLPMPIRSQSYITTTENRIGGELLLTTKNP